MSKNSDYLFLNLKQIYPNLNPPSDIDVEIWEDLLSAFDEEDIHAALKAYRASAKGGFPPLPAQLREYLVLYAKPKSEVPTLPLSPETYLMDEDIKAGRCKYFFPTYVRAVQYVFDEKLKEAIGEEKIATYSRGQRYRAAVDLGLFADFDKVLDYVYKEKY